MTDLISILIVEDHTVVREGLQALLSTEPELQVVAVAADGIEAVEKAREYRPDIILMDLIMPHKDGIEATTEIKRENPNARILVLTSFADDEKVFATIKAGALGYLLKDSSPQELIHAIREVYQGETTLHPPIARKLMRELNASSTLPTSQSPLTTREVDVLTQLGQGYSNYDIAVRLAISERTVRTHVSNILSKLHLANRTQAALYALREGFADYRVDRST